MNEKQKRFVEEYLKDLDATRAAVAAGYSAKTAYSAASRMLTWPHIKAAVNEAIAARSKRTGVSQDQVIEELRKIAFSNMGSVANWTEGGVKLKPSETLNPDEIGSVQSVEETVTKLGGSLKLKQYDKVKALELLGKHLGMFTEVVKHTTDETGFKIVIEDYTGKKKEP